MLAILFLFTSCSQNDSSPTSAKGEYIYRRQNDPKLVVPKPQPVSIAPYSWESTLKGNIPKITKDFFRCKGSSLNPVHLVQEKEGPVRYFDCGGAEKHSLPLRNNKEFIYPILIDLLNYIQTKTNKRVVITSGHRCPDHNTYVDASKNNQHSKHMIGAEVSFYVQGMENQPEKIINLLQKYFTEKHQDKEFTEFKRYQKTDVDVAIAPWYNKEVFIKLYQKKEGRNFDNRHPYSYISIQVRYDTETKEKVIYTWDSAFHNFLRH